MKPLLERLAIDADSDLVKLVQMYLQDDSEDLPRKSARHFELIAARHPGVLNHPTVLGVSLGGSYTKAMLASTCDGNIQVSHVSAVRNPDTPMHFYEFLDQLLISDPIVYEYLRSPSPRSIGFSIPVMIDEDDIPYHPTKLAAVRGLIARNPSEINSELNVTQNLDRYFALRNIPPPTIYFEADPIVAHIGSVSTIDVKADEQSLLLVCGTGMAVADYRVSRTISRLPMLDFDEELYPRADTENYGYEYSFAGVGLYGLMNRAIRIKAREPGSVLNPDVLCQCFDNRYDSKTVTEIWESTIPGVEVSRKVSSILAKAGNQGFTELQSIAAVINQRMVASLANAVIAVAVKLDRNRGPSTYFPVFEGGIVLNPHRLPLVKGQIRKILANDRLFAELGRCKPNFRIEERPQKAAQISDNASDVQRREVDTSLTGSVMGAITEDVLQRWPALKREFGLQHKPFEI